MNRFQRRFLWISTLLTAGTGVVYWWMKYMMDPVNEWAVINHPWQPLVLKLHILVAPLMVFAVGMLAVTHIWALWRAGLPRGRRTGFWTAVFFGPLVVSGYLIQAVTLPWLLTVVAWTHIVLGAVATAALVGHRLMVHKGLTRRKGSLNVVPGGAPVGSGGADEPDEKAATPEAEGTLAETAAGGR